MKKTVLASVFLIVLLSSSCSAGVSREQTGEPVTPNTDQPSLSTPATKLPVLTPPSTTISPALPPSMPVLVSPAEGATLDNGRFDGADDMVWDFDWSDMPGATRYQLYVIGGAASNPVINAETGDSSYHWVSNGSIGGDNLDQNRYGWTWKVRALVNGLWSGWSQRTFNVEPVDTDPLIPVARPPTPTTRPTPAPISTTTAPTTTQLLTPPPTMSVLPPALLPSTPVLLSPAEGAVVDNGRFDGRDNIVWDFNWVDAPGVTLYQICVTGAAASSPIINAQVGYSNYHWVNSGTIGGGNVDQYRYGWTWKVRVLVNGLWSAWSQRTFNVEPVDTDPPIPVTVPPPTITTTFPTPTPVPVPTTTATTTKPPTTTTTRPLTLTFAADLVPASSEYLAVYKPMLDEIEQKSNGRIRFTVFLGGSLVSAADQYDAIAAGVVDMGISYFSYITGRFPLSEAFTFPAAYSMTNAGEDLIQATGDLIFDLAPSETKVLCYFQQQPYFLYTANKQVKTLDDLVGLKIRATGTLPALVVSSLGAVPISLSSADIYEAIQRGIIDGALVTPSMADGLKLTDVTRYAWRLPLGYTVGMINVSAGAWSRIPADLKPIFEVAAGKARYNFVQKFNTDDAKINGALAVHGGAVFTPSATEQTRCVNAIKPVITQWIDDMESKGLPAQDLVDTIRVESQQRGLPFPY